MKNNSVYDVVHGQICISQLEKDIISSPIFNRLHNIYQHSTVYLTFPSLRVKRFEHSLGTMHLAGQYLDSVFSKKDDVLEDYFGKLVNEICSDDTNFVFNYSIKNHWELASIRKLDINFDLMYSIKFVHPNNKYFNFYKIVYQSVRLVGLLHDVGHPPFSHVTEKALEEIYYEQMGQKFNDILTGSSKRKEFIQKVFDYKEEIEIQTIISKSTLKELLYLNSSKEYSDFLTDFCISLKMYIDIKDVAKTKIQINNYIFSQFESYLKDFMSIFHDDSSIINLALHEYMGNKFMKILFNKISVNKDDDDSIKIFYNMVCDLVINIIQENNITTLLYTLHSIISSELDVDRLDYVTREQISSGIYDYKTNFARIFDSLLLREVKYKARIDGEDVIKKRYQFVADTKSLGEIDDFFIRRFTSYSQMIFHHRSIKMGYLLKYVIKMVVNESFNEENYFTELWKSIDSSSETIILLWDDNYLWSNLQKLYVKKIITDAPRYKKIENHVIELVSNRKVYCSLIKRQCDFELVSNEFRNHQKSIKQNLIDQFKNAIDSSKSFSLGLLYKNLCDKKSFMNLFLNTYLGDSSPIGISELDLNLYIDEKMREKYSSITDSFIVFNNIKTGISDYLNFRMSKNDFVTKKYIEISPTKEYLSKLNEKYPTFYYYYKLDTEDTIDETDMLKYIGELLFEICINKINEFIKDVQK